MPTRIVFDNGGEVIAAESEEEVVHAIRRDHPNPVALESDTGGPLHVNWMHVAFVAEVLAVPSEEA
ncbi:MAG TPA: hypothetical protein VEJ23_05130 [Solirubrobacteraceae bacterium]|nr:hypothetical protein [Solirubrobacteraceae bacterium]